MFYHSGGGRKPEGATGGGGRDDSDDDGRDEAAEALARLVAQMFLLQGARSTLGPQHLIQAAANNSVKTVKDLLTKDKNLVCWESVTNSICYGYVYIQCNKDIYVCMYVCMYV